MKVMIMRIILEFQRLILASGRWEGVRGIPRYEGLSVEG